LILEEYLSINSYRTEQRKKGGLFISLREGRLGEHKSNWETKESKKGPIITKIREEKKVLPLTKIHFTKKERATTYYGGKKRRKEFMLSKKRWEKKPHYRSTFSRPTVKKKKKSLKKNLPTLSMKWREVHATYGQKRSPFWLPKRVGNSFLTNWTMKSSFMALD